MVATPNARIWQDEEDATALDTPPAPEATETSVPVAVTQPVAQQPDSPLFDVIYLGKLKVGHTLYAERMRASPAQVNTAPGETPTSETCSRAVLYLLSQPGRKRFRHKKAKHMHVAVSTSRLQVRRCMHRCVCHVCGAGQWHSSGPWGRWGAFTARGFVSRVAGIRQSLQRLCCVADNRDFVSWILRESHEGVIMYCSYSFKAR